MTAQRQLASAEEEFREAEREAEEAAGLVSALEAQILDGDEKITAAKLASTRDLAAFAKLRLEAVRRKLWRAQEDRELEELRSVREEMESFAATSGARYVELVNAAVDAVAAFKAAAAERNEKLADWRARAEAAGAPFGEPHDDDGGVALGEKYNEVAAGRVRMTQMEPDYWLSAALGTSRPFPHSTTTLFGPSRADLDVLAQFDGPAER